jgi:hypothetical protein
MQRSFNGYNLNAGFDLDHTTGQAQSISSALSCLDKGFRLRHCKSTAFKLLVHGLNRSPTKPDTIAPRLRIAFGGISLQNAMKAQAPISAFKQKVYMAF